MSQTPAENLVFKNKTLSVIEGMLYALMVAFGESLIVPCALFLNLRPTEIAIVSTLPIALGGLSQFLTPYLQSHFPHRRRFIFSLMFVQVLGVGFLFFPQQPQFLHFLMASIFYWVGGAGVQPIWVSWMIPENPSQKLSLYHARRGALLSFVTCAAFVACGAMLKSAPRLALFQTFFLVAAGSRLLGATLILFHHDLKTPPFGANIQTVETKEVRKSLGNQSVLILLGILMLFRFGSGLSAPHFSQYMLRDLQLSYLTYTVLIGSSYLGRTLLAESWILTSHRFGSKTTLVTSCFVISLLPALWMLHTDVRWFFSLELIGGGAWAAFDLLPLLILAHMKINHFSRYVGLMGMLVTLAALASGYLGGILLEQGQPMSVVFYWSSALRLLGAGLLFLMFRFFEKEETSIKQFVPIFFSTLSLRPSFANINRLFWRRTEDRTKRRD